MPLPLSYEELSASSSHAGRCRPWPAESMETVPLNLGDIAPWPEMSAPTAPRETESDYQQPTSEGRGGERALMALIDASGTASSQSPVAAATPVAEAAADPAGGSSVVAHPPPGNPSGHARPVSRGADGVGSRPTTPATAAVASTKAASQPPRPAPPAARRSAAFQKPPPAAPPSRASARSIAPRGAGQPSTSVGGSAAAPPRPRSRPSASTLQPGAEKDPPKIRRVLSRSGLGGGAAGQRIGAGLWPEVESLRETRQPIMALTEHPPLSPADADRLFPENAGQPGRNFSSAELQWPPPEAWDAHPEDAPAPVPHGLEAIDESKRDSRLPSEREAGEPEAEAKQVLEEHMEWVQSGEAQRRAEDVAELMMAASAPRPGIPTLESLTGPPEEDDDGPGTSQGSGPALGYKPLRLSTRRTQALADPSLPHQPRSPAVHLHDPGAVAHPAHPTLRHPDQPHRHPHDLHVELRVQSDDVFPTRRQVSDDGYGPAGPALGHAASEDLSARRRTVDDGESAPRAARKSIRIVRGAPPAPGNGAMVRSATWAEELERLDDLDLEGVGAASPRKPALNEDQRRYKLTLMHQQRQHQQRELQHHHHSSAPTAVASSGRRNQRPFRDSSFASVGSDNQEEGPGSPGRGRACKGGILRWTSSFRSSADDLHGGRRTFESSDSEAEPSPGLPRSILRKAGESRRRMRVTSDGVESLADDFSQNGPGVAGNWFEGNMLVRIPQSAAANTAPSLALHLARPAPLVNVRAGTVSGAFLRSLSLGITFLR